VEDTLSTGSEQQSIKKDPQRLEVGPLPSKISTQGASEKIDDEAPAINAKSGSSASRKGPHPQQPLRTLKSSSKTDLIARMLFSRKPGAAPFLLKSKRTR
jgi:hypothetical protein